MKDSKLARTNTFIGLIVMAFLVIFIVVAAYPLGNHKTPNGILGSFESTGAAIVLVGFPYLLLRFT